MGKSKKKKSNDNAAVTNNVTVEIDYEKLADAIVKAQKKAEEKSSGSEAQQKEPFFKATWRRLKTIGWIVINKKDARDTDGRMTMGLMSIPLWALFNVSAAFVFLVAIAAFACPICLVCTSGLTATNAFSFLLVPVSILLGLFALLLRGAANEMDRTNDKNFVVAVFSGIVGVVALIVALVALVKGENFILNLFP